MTQQIPCRNNIPGQGFHETSKRAWKCRTMQNMCSVGRVNSPACSIMFYSLPPTLKDSMCLVWVSSSWWNSNKHNLSYGNTVSKGFFVSEVWCLKESVEDYPTCRSICPKHGPLALKRLRLIVIFLPGPATYSKKLSRIQVIKEVNNMLNWLGDRRWLSYVPVGV